jgi:transposase
MEWQAGTNPITVLGLVLTLEQVERFAPVRKVASEAGLIPAEYSSCPQQRLGDIRKEGSAFLRWVLMEVATVATHHGAERLVEPHGKAVAKVTFAHMLLKFVLDATPAKARARSSPV